MRVGDWITIASVLIPLVGLQIVNIIQAVRAKETAHAASQKMNSLYAEVKPPSNGVTNGTHVENTSYGLTWLLHLIASEKGIDLPPPPPPSVPETLPDRRAVDATFNVPPPFTPETPNAKPS